MRESELPSDRNSAEENKNTDKILRDLPERYFELMSSGSKLAKQGAFSEAAQQFSAAQIEGSRILQRLFELSKSDQVIKWQVLSLLWGFKLIKSIFYSFLAKGETAKNSSDRQNLLLAAMGAQQVGRNLITAFASLDQILAGKNRELLLLLAEAIQNFEERQQLLEKELQQQGIDIAQLKED